MALHLCASCARHVKSVDATCPFCGAAEFSPVPRPKSRATRAAMVFGGAVMVSAAVACSSTTPSDDGGSTSPLYGAPATDASSQEDTSAVALYGLPADASFDSAAPRDASDAGDSDAAPVALYGAVPADAARD